MREKIIPQEIKKISPESEEYKKNYGDLHHHIIQDYRSEIFGSEIPSDALKIIRDDSPENSEHKKGLVKKIEASKKALEKLMQDPDSKEAVYHFCQHWIEELDAMEDILDKYPEKKAVIDFLENPTLEKFNECTIPDEVYLKLLNIHGDSLRKEAARFKKKIQILKEKFINAYTAIATEEDLPLTVSDIITRLQDIEYGLADELISSLEEKSGQYDPEMQLILISTECLQDPGILKQVFFHEIFHALSGKTVIQKKFEDGDPIIDHQRTGVHFDGQEMSRFSWLNEGITEYLSQQVFQKQSKPSEDEKLIARIGHRGIVTTDLGLYYQERQLYALLCLKGATPIDTKKFMAAYFEDFDPALPEGKRIPHWKALWQAINEAYEPGFLVKLDRFVQEKGVEAAVDAMEKDWHTI